MQYSRKLVHLSAIVYLGALAIGAFGGCAALTVRERETTLPVYAQPSGFGQIQARAWESDSYFYVSGTFRKAFGTHNPHNLRVRVVLEDGDGRTLQVREDRIPPTSPRRAASARASHSFAAKFPLGEIPKASAVRVILKRGGQS